MPQSEADAMWGAAYSVVFERVNNPDRCVTRELRDAIQPILNSIAEWAGSQSPEICAAYRRAVVDIGKRADDVLENNDRRRRMNEIRNTLPLPPEPEE